MALREQLESKHLKPVLIVFLCIGHVTWSKRRVSSTPIIIVSKGRISLEMREFGSNKAPIMSCM